MHLHKTSFNISYHGTLILPPKSIADSFTSCFFSTFNFAISTGLFLSRQDGDHARWKSLSYRLHRMHDYFRSLIALVLARDLCILRSTFAKFYAFLLGKPFFSNHELGSQSCSFLHATEYFFQQRTTHKPVSYLLQVFRYNYQQQRKMALKRCIGRSNILYFIWYHFCL